MTINYKGYLYQNITNTGLIDSINYLALGDSGAPFAGLVDAALNYAPGPAGEITGALVNHQIAYGNVTANSIQGSPNLTFDGSIFSLKGHFSLAGATSGTVSITAAGTTTPYSLTLPIAQASGTQVLQNNGSGVLSWATVAGGGTIGGSITENEIAFGNVTANSIQGSADLTYDGSDFNFNSSTQTAGVVFNIAAPFNAAYGTTPNLLSAQANSVNSQIYIGQGYATPWSGQPDAGNYFVPFWNISTTAVASGNYFRPTFALNATPSALFANYFDTAFLVDGSTPDETSVVYINAANTAGTVNYSLHVVGPVQCDETLNVDGIASFNGGVEGPLEVRVNRVQDIDLTVGGLTVLYTPPVGTTFIPTKIVVSNINISGFAGSDPTFSVGASAGGYVDIVASNTPPINSLGEQIIYPYRGIGGLGLTYNSSTPINLDITAASTTPTMTADFDVWGIFVRG